MNEQPQFTVLLLGFSISVVLISISRKSSISIRNTFFGFWLNGTKSNIDSTSTLSLLLHRGDLSA